MALVTDVRVAGTLDASNYQWLWVDLDFDSNPQSSNADAVTVTGTGTVRLQGVGWSSARVAAIQVRLSTGTLPATGNFEVVIGTNFVTPNLDSSHTAAFTWSSRTVSKAVPARSSATITVASSGVSGGTLPVTIEFDRDVTGLALNDFSVTNGGRLSNLSGSGRSYTATLTLPSGTGDVRLRLRANRVTPNNDVVNVRIRHSPLTLTLTPRLTAVRASATVVIDIVFSSPVTGFTLSDITLTGGGSLSSFEGSGDSYSVRWTAPSSGAGSATISVAADAVTGGGSPSASATVRYRGSGLSTVGRQVLLVRTPFRVQFTATAPPGETVTNVDVRGLWIGFTYESTLNSDETIASVAITGTPESTLGSELWDVVATYSDGSDDMMEIEYSVIPKLPVFQDIEEQIFRKDVDSEMFVPVDNFAGDAVAHGSLIGLKFSGADADEEGAGGGISVTGIPDKTRPTGSEARVQTVNPRDDSLLTRNQRYRVIDEAALAMSPVTVTPTQNSATFTWTPVATAHSYAYQMGNSGWIDVGNVTTYEFTDLPPDTAYTTSWRVNRVWRSEPVVVEWGTGDVPGPIFLDWDLTTVLPQPSYVPYGFVRYSYWVEPERGHNPILEYQYREAPGSGELNASPEHGGVPIYRHNAVVVPESEYRILQRGGLVVEPNRDTRIGDVFFIRTRVGVDPDNRNRVHIGTTANIVRFSEYTFDPLAFGTVRIYLVGNDPQIVDMVSGMVQIRARNAVGWSEWGVWQSLGGVTEYPL